MAAINQQVVKKEHLLTEWKQPVNGDENKFINALQNKIINKSNIEELKQVLLIVMVKIGLKAQNFPLDEEKAILIEHIISNYGNHTISEIKLAFDMAISQKLDIDEKNIICYENFSCVYFSSIMNAYRRWAIQTYNQLKKDFPKMIEEKKILTDEEKAEWICDWKSMPEINIELIPLIFYDFLNDNKIIKVTPKQKDEYTQKAFNYVKGLLHQDISYCKTNDALIAFNKFESMEKEGFTGEFKGRILNRAKRLIVYDYLKGFIE